MADERSIEELIAHVEANANFAEALNLTVPEMAKLAQHDLNTMTKEQKEVLLEALFEITGTTRTDADIAHELTMLLIEQGQNDVQFEDMLGVTTEALRLFKVSIEASPIPEAVMNVFGDDKQEIFIMGLITGMGCGAVWARRHGAQ